MKKYLTVVFIILFISSTLLSQSSDSLLKFYNTRTIYQNGNKFIKGDQKLSYHDLESEFNTPPTINLYQKSKSHLFLSRMFTVASLGVAATSIFVKTDTKGSIQFSLGSGILALVGIYFHTRSSQYLEKALWEKNREILFTPSH